MKRLSTILLLLIVPIMLFGQKTCLKQHDVPLVTNDIEAGSIVVVVFDGTNWQMVSPVAN